MALFKILKGNEANLPADKHEGWAYVTEKGNMYVDLSNDKRVKIGNRADSAEFADKATGDTKPIRDIYLAKLAQVESTGSKFTFRGITGGGDNAPDLISIPLAGDLAGLVSNVAQTIKGTKTFANGIAFPDVSSTTYPATSQGLSWTGSTDGAKIYYEVQASDKGMLVVEARDDTNAGTIFRNSSSGKTVSIINGLVTGSFKGNIEGIATQAVKDNLAQVIDETYMKYPLSISGETITMTRGDGVTNTITVPDTKVTQTAVKASDYTNWRPIVWGSSNSGTEGFTPTTVRNQVYTAQTLSVQPSSGTIRATTFKGALKGNADTATNATYAEKDKEGNIIADTYIATLKQDTSNGTTFSFKGVSANGDVRPDTISIPAATASIAGLVTTGTQTWTGAKTLDSKGSLVISKAAGFNYIGIETATAAQYRDVWFADSSRVGTPVHNSKFQYNPACTDKWTNYDTATPTAYGSLKADRFTGIAQYAAKDVDGNLIASYVKSVLMKSGSNYIIEVTTGGGAKTEVKPYFAASASCGGDANQAIKTKDLGNHTEAASGTAANAPSTGMLYASGMYMTRTYTDSNTPTNYGNIINVAGAGTGQLLLGWSGTDSTTGNIYYRSHRDTNTGGWGAWKQLVYTDGTVKNAQYAEKDKEGNIIADSYVSTIVQDSSTGTTFSFKGVSANGDARPNTISIPAASATVAGLVTNAAQTFAGVKTFKNNIDVKGKVIIDLNGNKVEIGSDNKSYFHFLVRGQAVTPLTFWFGGPIQTAGNITPYGHNTYNLGSSSSRWKTGYFGSGGINVSGTITDKDANELRASLFVSTLYVNTSTGSSFIIGGKNTVGDEITTLTIPNASTTSVGLITNTAQTLAGNKTLQGKLVVSDSNTSATTKSSILQLTSSSNGNVGMEFWRGSNASWQIINSGGDLIFRNNYKDSAESAYNYQSLVLHYSTGAGRIPYLGVNGENTSYRLYVNGATYLDGSLKVQTTAEIHGITTHHSDIQLDATTRLRRNGRSSSWNTSNTYSMITMDTQAGWAPLWALKANSGWWTMGHYNASGFNDHLIIGFLSNVDVSGQTNAINHLDYKVRLLPTVYATNTSTETDRAFVTAPYASAKAVVGSSTRPVYVNDSGVVTACSYYLKATLNSGTAYRLPYYSSSTAISQTSHYANTTQIGINITNTDIIGDHILYISGKTRVADGDLYVDQSIRNLQVGGGIYWNPYVESTSDASDAASITLIKSGIAGGSELRIQQANDQTDVINLIAPYYIYLNSKRAFAVNDSWLRINENSAFSSGIYTGSSLVRSDNQLQVGSAGANFYANNSGNAYIQKTLGIAMTDTAYSLAVKGFTKIITKTDAEKTWTDSANLIIGNAPGSLHIATSSTASVGTAITDGYETSITFGSGDAAYAGIYSPTSGDFGNHLIFATTGSYKNGAYARMIIRSDGSVGIGSMTTNSKKFYVSGSAQVTNRLYITNWIEFTDTTGLYTPNSGAGTHFYPNVTSSYGSYKIQGAKGGYVGFLIGPDKNYFHIMSNSTNEGLYNESKSRWILHYNRVNNNISIGDSTSRDSYLLNIAGSTYIAGDLRILNDVTVDGVFSLTSWTGNSMVWTNASKEAQASNHYVDTDRVAINTLTRPGYNFYVNGSSYFTGTLLAASVLKLGVSSQTSIPTAGIHIHDLRDCTITPNSFGDQRVNFYFDQINDAFDGAGATNKWMGIMHVKGWTGSYAAWQLAGGADSSYSNDTLRYRAGSGTTWGAWQSVLTDSNYKLYTQDYFDGRYVNVTGDTMTGLLTVTTGSSHGGIKMGTTYVTSISGDVIFQNNNAIRFGTDSWDYNCWAGLKYNHSNKTVYLGLADGSIFTANAAQSGGTLALPGIRYLSISGKTVIDVNNLLFTGTAKDVAPASFRTTDGGANYILIKINNPTHYMTAFTVRVYQGYNVYDVTFSGYQYGANYWYSPAASLNSCSTMASLTVYFGYNSTTEMWVALPGSSYTGAKVLNVVNGYQPLDITNAFSISRVSALPGTIQSTQTIYRPWKRGESVTSAVWNDYAECRKSDTQEPGYVMFEKGDDSLSKTIERLQHFAGIVSDTWGFSQGETADAKTNIAVAGRVLAYPYRDRNEYKPGDCVCAAPGGKVDIMTREEIVQYPDRIVGTVSCVPDYEEWGGGESADRDPVKVNGRIWIKVR